MLICLISSGFKKMPRRLISKTVWNKNERRPELLMQIIYEITIIIINHMVFFFVEYQMVPLIRDQLQERYML